MHACIYVLNESVCSLFAKLLSQFSFALPGATASEASGHAAVPRRGELACHLFTFRDHMCPFSVCAYGWVCAGRRCAEISIIEFSIEYSRQRSGRGIRRRMADIVSAVSSDQGNIGGFVFRRSVTTVNVKLISFIREAVESVVDRCVIIFTGAVTDADIHTRSGTEEEREEARNNFVVKRISRALRSTSVDDTSADVDSVSYGAAGVIFESATTSADRPV
jgi:hypothetical protein